MGFPVIAIDILFFSYNDEDDGDNPPANRELDPLVVLKYTSG